MELSTICVALCADKNIEVGLHVTLYSLLESQQHSVRIYFLQKGYNSADIVKIQKTLQPFDGKYELKVIDFDDHIFSKYRGLFGNKFTFVRLMLSSLLPEDKVIYLDSDLVVKKDLSSLFCLNLNEYVIGVSGIGNIGYSLENKFFISIGLDNDARYFNAGVMLINLEKWRQLNITKQCLEFADKYPNMLLAADQTILNYVFYKNNFYELDKSYNVALYPSSVFIESDSTNGVFHFVGSPKPWDFLGEFIHSNYPLFQSILSKTEFKNYKTYLDLSFAKLKRTLRLSRSYYKILTNRFRQ